MEEENQHNDCSFCFFDIETVNFFVILMQIVNYFL